jgi:hypothetical protein
MPHSCVECILPTGDYTNYALVPTLFEVWIVSGRRIGADLCRLSALVCGVVRFGVDVEDAIRRNGRGQLLGVEGGVKMDPQTATIRFCELRINLRKSGPPSRRVA